MKLALWFIYEKSAFVRDWPSVWSVSGLSALQSFWLCLTTVVLFRLRALIYAILENVILDKEPSC